MQTPPMWRQGCYSAEFNGEPELSLGLSVSECEGVPMEEPVRPCEVPEELFLARSGAQSARDYLELHGVLKYVAASRM